MTRDEQSTERALTHAEAQWLTARGWTCKTQGTGSMHAGARWTHPDLRGSLSTNDLSQRDALTLTRAEPLRFRRR